MITTNSAISPRLWRPSPSAERLVLALQWSRLRHPIYTVGLESDESCRSGASPGIQAIFRAASKYGHIGCVVFTGDSAGSNPPLWSDHGVFGNFSALRKCGIGKRSPDCHLLERRLWTMSRACQISRLGDFARRRRAVGF